MSYINLIQMTTAQAERINARRIPADYKVYKETAEAVCYVSADGLIAKMFKGTAQKPIFWTRFRTPESLEKYVAEYFGRFASWEKMKSERKQSGLTQTQIIKKALKSAFTYMVSVTKGKGTACGWIHVDFYGVPRDLRETVSLEAYKVLKLALAQASKKEGQDFRLSTYTSDDGYNSERECLLLQFRD